MGAQAVEGVMPCPGWSSGRIHWTFRENGKNLGLSPFFSENNALHSGGEKSHKGPLA